jgi:hypothetical protein
MARLLEWLGVVVGGAFYIGLMFFMLLSLPFSVLALMRWFDFSWWGALLLLVGLNFIPFAGWIAYVILTIVGCYFFVSEGFSFQRASTAPQVSAVSAPSASAVPSPLKVAFKKSCLDDNSAFAKTSAERGWSRSQYEAFCECAAALMYRKMTLSELEYVQTHKQPSPAFQNAVAAEIGTCAP